LPTPQPKQAATFPLLFDQNLSDRLVEHLADLFPGSAHVRDLGLDRSNDETVWIHAKSEGFILVTKDDDFRQRSFLYGHPPKVIWVRLGNCTTADVETVLRSRHADILAFASDETASVLLLGGAT
jgi:predicted nuclease of predicted toxin-antitoxin system